MNKKQKVALWCGISLILTFILWTALLTCIDVGDIGPSGSKVGFSSFNGYFHKLVGVNMTLYTVTDWLGILPVLVALGFAVLGLVQLIRRKSLFSVDKSILLLGAFYITVIATFIFFERTVINYRPVLIEGVLEASYPSSTTLLFSTVMPTAIIELMPRIDSKPLRRVIFFLLSFITLFGVVGRIISGVHWISDIIGGIVYSAGLDLILWSLNEKIRKLKK